VEVFSTVCCTVEERFFDPEHRGKDWLAIQARHKARIFGAEDKDTFYDRLNAMLFELEVSHLGVIPSRDVWQLVEPTVFAPGSPGLDIRVIAGEAVITEVDPESPAAATPLRPGWIVRSVDGVAVEQIRAERLERLEPPFNKRASFTNEILGRLFGAAGSTLRLDVVDEDGGSQQIEFTRAARGTPTSYGPDLPEFYEELDVITLPGGSTVIRFNTFMPGNGERFVLALARIKPDSGLIIDLRGNPGGHRLVAEALAGLFVSKPTLFARLDTRNGKRDIIIEPTELTFTGRTVILVDVMSRSASEVFAAGMQSIGRARVFGERTTGSVGPADSFPLPNGATLICPIGLTTTPDGRILEGIGVEPDWEVALDRAAVLEGRDTALMAAVRFLSEQRSSAFGD
jgi:carboxyl-terminal processing protease